MIESLFLLLFSVTDVEQLPVRIKNTSEANNSTQISENTLCYRYINTHTHTLSDLVISFSGLCCVSSLCVTMFMC